MKCNVLANRKLDIQLLVPNGSSTTTAGRTNDIRA